MYLFPKLMRRLVRTGRLEIHGPQGFHRLIDSGRPGPNVAIRIHRWRGDAGLLKNPTLGLAEAYLNGHWSFERSTMYDFFRLLRGPFSKSDRIGGGRRTFSATGIAKAMTRAAQNLPVISKVGTDPFGYSKGHAFFGRMLDSGLSYSCGYWEDGVETLEQAQTAKLRHIAAKLAVKPGQHVLDVGCGWGSVSLYLATVCGAQVTGVAMSQTQLDVARDRADRLGIADRVEFRHQDFRKVTGQFDRVVSVEMLEQVGLRSMQGYFDRVHDWLTPDGVALVQCVTSRHAPARPSAFVRKYMDKKGVAPSYSDLFARIERTGLFVLDCEVWRQHYNRTMEEWAARFAAHRERTAAEYGERFARLWEYALGGTRASYDGGGLVLSQVMLAPKGTNAPATRDFIAAAKPALSRREAESGWNRHVAIE